MTRLVALGADVVFSDLPVIVVGRRPVAVPDGSAEDVLGEVAARCVGFIRSASGQ